MALNVLLVPGPCAKALRLVKQACQCADGMHHLGEGVSWGASGGGEWGGPPEKVGHPLIKP